MEAFEQLLFDLKALSINKSEQGTRFEKLIKQFLLTDRLYSEQYETVWMWVDFPYNGGKHDSGIDLVAKRYGTDEYCAIQCKFYDENHSVSKDDVDTFLSASGKSFTVNGQPMWFAERLIVSTTDKWSQTAEDTIIGQNPPVNRLRLKDLKDSSIDWKSFSLTNPEKMQRSQLKVLRPHQTAALDDVVNKFATAERGKLIMACGTGKTFTSLRIAEAMTNGKGNVLFLVPSISLLNQSLTEWSAQCKYEFHVYAICSDPRASKTTSSDSVVDTIIPATTDVHALAVRYKQNNDGGFQLFFSTYQSIDVVAKVQKQIGFEFDLIICDEAHRTTGVTLADEDESSFVKVHDNDFIKAKRRLYMTATPRIYGDESKQKAGNKNAVLCSMDDETIYGEELHRLGFSEAVELGLLSDYKVLVMAVDENYVSRALQKLITDSNNELSLDDSVKIVGCLNALSKKTLYQVDEEGFATDPTPMRRAVAFTSTIEGSKKFKAMLTAIQDEYKIHSYDDKTVTVEIDHVDGKNNALFRKDRIDWLKADAGENVCRVLSNARCLSEGIDVPALDAVMFLNPRKSIVDIVQSVGRVMRKTADKKYGYIILPIGIPAGMEPEEALADNEKYKIVWDVLQALRAHDDRFNNTINKIELNKKKPNNISIIGVSGGEEKEGDDGGYKEPTVINLTMDLSELENWKNCIYAKIVKKCGSRQYWETWAKDIADIATRHINEIRILLEQEEIAKKFQMFVEGLRSNLNPTISEEDAIEMLAEHMITKPVFNALFDNYEFVKHNPVSIIMQDMLDTLHEHALEKEQETLDKFYHSVQDRAKDLDNAEARQKVILELYEQFFKNALPKQVAKLGIVYTPVQVVNFIINSVDEVLKDRFGQSLSDKNVHVLDPFTGTGTFIVQLLRSGLIRKEDLLYKYTKELHANEIVLLAYYIAAINIEKTFHELYQAEEYTPFEGIVLTDTFEMSERAQDDDGNYTDEKQMNVFQKNSYRAEQQLAAPIRVIIGNPPYSVGQKSANDNNQNVTYPKLDLSVSRTYVEKSHAVNARAAYDTYIKSFRWATDRIGENGIIGFVTNGSWLDAVALDGFRKCLLEEFNAIYCFNLRGNQRTSGELSRKEGGKIFGSGSRTPVCITILVKKKGVRKDGFVHYHDIGDYLSKDQKLDIIQKYGTISKISWERLTPDENGDWLNQRNPNFVNYIAIADRKKSEKESIWSNNVSSGLGTRRDAWIIDYSPKKLKARMGGFVEFYNSEIKRCEPLIQKETAPEQILLELRNNDPTKISWSRGLHRLFVNKTKLVDNDEIRTIMLRPFCKEHLYYDTNVIEYPSRWNSIFPDAEYQNLIICTSGSPAKKPFSVLITNCIQNDEMLEHAVCFPMYLYDEEKADGAQVTLFDIMPSEGEQKSRYKKRYAISDAALKKFQKLYGSKVSKEDIFYYVYAVLHSKDYIGQYADNLSKELPRIPTLDKFYDWMQLGRDLADLHLHYEKPADPAALGLTINMTVENYTVEKMRFTKEGKTEKKDTIIYNPYITISGIPERAYDYIINGMSAIEWIMEKYQVTVDKASGIRNDPNDYAGGKYIFDLLISIISMSLKTLDLVDKLPEYKEI